MLDLEFLKKTLSSIYYGQNSRKMPSVEAVSSSALTFRLNSATHLNFKVVTYLNVELLSMQKFPSQPDAYS